MSYFSLCKLTARLALYPRLFYKRSFVYSSFKLCVNKPNMEVASSVISKPYQNGISSIKTESAKWKDEKKTKIPLRPIAVCGPSGSGKSTLLKRLLKEFGDCVEFSISHTTRAPRPGEVDGRDYHFVTREEMERAIANGEFLEYAEFSGNLYGTSKNSVAQIQNRGKICILDVEMVGVTNLKKTDLEAKFIFIKPPSLAELERRLRYRNTETEESLQKRLARAVEELKFGEIPDNFQFILVNDNKDEAYSQLKEYLQQDLEEAQRLQH